VNVCGDVVLAVYGPETMSVDEPSTATATSHAATAAAAADARLTSSTAVTNSTELNIPEILVNS